MTTAGATHLLSRPSLDAVRNGTRDLYPRLMLVLLLGGAMRGYSAPYINLFLTERGFSGTVIGSMLSAAALVELLAIPLFSRLSDRARSHRLFFRALMAGYVVACIALFTIPVPALVLVFALITQVNLRSTFVFGMQLAFTRFAQLGKDLFGRVRSMSAGGFMLANLTAGAVFALGSYAALFTAAATSGALALTFSNAMPLNTVDKPDEAGTIGRSRQLYVFLASQFFVTMGIRNGFGFWLVHFQENLGIATEQIAIVITLAAALEIPWFLSMDRVLKRWNTANLYLLGAVLFGVVWALTGIVPGFWWVLLLLVPRGLAFATWNLSALFRINEISQPQNVSTNQALGQITIPGIAALISGWPMGYIYDNYPPQVFFSIICGMLFIGAGITFVARDGS